MIQHKIENDQIYKETEEILNRFLSSLYLANKSHLTIKKHKGILEKFFEKVNIPIENLVSEDVFEYIENYYKKYSDVTKTNYMNILSKFFNFCKDEEHIDEETILVKRKWKPKIPGTLPRYINSSDLARLGLVAEKDSLRNRMILELLLSTGCRVAEIQGLDIEKIDFENNKATVTGKGNKTRVVKFNEKSSIILRKYLKEHPVGTGPLFLGQNNKRISIRTIQRIITNQGIQAELSIRISPHNCRHTTASVLLVKGAKIEDIQVILGHENIKTTQIYANLPLGNIIQLYKRYM